MRMGADCTELFTLVQNLTCNAVNCAPASRHVRALVPPPRVAHNSRKTTPEGLCCRSHKHEAVDATIKFQGDIAKTFFLYEEKQTKCNLISGRERGV